MGAENQLRLQMDLPPAYDYGAWIRHAGVEEACNRLALWSVHGGNIWLASESSAGKTHLLRTFAADQAAVAMLDAPTDNQIRNSWQLAQQWMESLQGYKRWLIDVPAGAMAEPVALALFHLLERARDLQCSIVIAWRGEVDDLPPELSSRLLAMEKINMAPPADDDVLLNVLRSSAGRLQWDIREQVLQAMLTYLPRQLDILVAALQALETLSFEQKHKPGPAWVKQQLTRIAKQLHPSLL
jgi:chromosomal replication initiation ATPase DnaA